MKLLMLIYIKLYNTVNIINMSNKLWQKLFTSITDKIHFYCFCKETFIIISYHYFIYISSTLYNIYFIPSLQVKLCQSLMYLARGQLD